MVIMDGCDIDDHQHSHCVYGGGDDDADPENECDGDDDALHRIPISEWSVIVASVNVGLNSLASTRCPQLVGFSLLSSMVGLIERPMESVQHIELDRT